MTRLDNKKRVYSWVLYDWANSAFSTTVIAGFFPVFFKQYLSVGADVATSTLRLGMANSIASIVVALLSPVLGAIADKGGAKKRFLFIFAMMGIVMTGALCFVRQGHWEIGVMIYVTAALGFSTANSFYDSLLLSVTSAKRTDYISALGFSFGYLGGGVLFALNVAMTLEPAMFGLRDAAHAARVSFATVALWWAFFSIPIFLFVEESPGSTRGVRRSVAAGLRQFKRTFSELRRLSVVFLFLV